MLTKAMRLIALVSCLILATCRSPVTVRSEVVNNQRVFIVSSTEPVNLRGISVYVAESPQMVWGMTVYPKKSWGQSKSDADFFDVANWKKEYRIVYGKIYDEHSRNDLPPKALEKGKKYWIEIGLNPIKYNTTYTFEH